MDIKTLERKIELKEQEIFLLIEEKMKELKDMKERLTELYERKNN